jgi:hypothetical protein
MFSTETLDIRGYRDAPVPHTFYRQPSAASHLALLLPGRGYTAHMPLLYYTVEALFQAGADVLQVEYNYIHRADFQAAPEAEQARWLFADVTAAYQAGTAQRAYRQITLAGKSLGTLAMAHLLAQPPPPAPTQGIWLTPLLHQEQVTGAIRQWGGRSLFVIGTADPVYDAAILNEMQAATNGETVVVSGADHSLEIPGDVLQSVHVLEHVMQAVQAFLTTSSA